MSEIRKQFTFYRSYWEALRGMGKRDRQAVLEAVILYALDNLTPNGLTGVQQAMFTLIQPTLDTGRRKALSGKLGGSKPKAKHKQTEREKEIEKEIENDIEKELEWEKEKDKRSSDPDCQERELFDLFWEAYPFQIGKQTAWEEWLALSPNMDTVEKIMVSLEGWKASRQWLQDRGRYIPRAAKWLSEGHWMAPPAPEPSQGEFPRQLDGDEQAAIRRMMEEDMDAGAL